MFKRFMRSRAVQITLGWWVAAYMVVVKYTTRWDVTISEEARALMGSGDGFIAMTWHSRFLMLNAAWSRKFQMPYVLISRSRDGEIVAHTSHALGLKTIRGSAKKASKTDSKGGAAAGRAITEAIIQGGCIVITPDGPRGPRQRLSSGALRLAKISGAPIVPCLFSVQHRKVFNSWDRFVLPFPFGRGRIIWGTPRRLAADMDSATFEALRQDIELEMNTLLTHADTDMGHDPIEPAS